jgi:hypothetical protein
MSSILDGRADSDGEPDNRHDTQAEAQAVAADMEARGRKQVY